MVSSLLTVPSLSPALATFAGTEITDVVRKANTQGDGREYPSKSVGVYRAATNLITNGGFETNTTGWVNVGAAISRITTQFKFGLACGQIVTDNLAAGEGDYHAFAGAASTRYVCSAWVRGTAGGTVYISLWDDVSTFQNSAAVTLTTAWQRIYVSGVTGAASVTFRAYVRTDVQQGITYQVDGLQVEGGSVALGSYPTPYIETDGGTATRAIGRVQIPHGRLTALQGWVAFRVRVPATDEQFLTGNIGNCAFNWRIGATDQWLIFLRSASSDWRMRVTDAVGSDDPATAAQDFLTETEHTVIGYWTPLQVGISANGVAFVTAVRARFPAGALPLNFEIGSVAGTAQSADMDFKWFAWGEGVLTSGDAAYINSFGVRDPDPRRFPGLLVGYWDANNGLFRRRAR